jgi:hypothetical protein
MLMSWKWPNVEKTFLAKLVLDDAKSWLPDPLPFVWNDLHGSDDSRRELVKALYQTMLRYRVSYTPEKYSPDAEVQLVRTPGEILGPREGTCLDLSLLFCGLCLGCELIPWLVVVQGHAFVLVSRVHRLRKWNDRSRSEWKLFVNGPLTDLAPLQKGLEQGTYLAVECTGFARSASLGGGRPGTRRGRIAQLRGGGGGRAGAAGICAAAVQVRHRPGRRAVHLGYRAG